LRSFQKRWAAEGIVKRSVEAAEIWFVMRKATHWCRLHAALSVSKLDISISDFAVLAALRARGPLRPDAIGKKVLLTSGSVTAALDRLEQEALIERRVDPVDRRASLVYLTDRGADLIRRAHDKHTSSMEEVFSVLNAEERQDLRRLMKKVGKFAEAMHSERDPAVKPKKLTAPARERPTLPAPRR
jgi:MarR family transcriptional regulator, 2-MHQ and catechol-resistance regulon repressor